MITITLHVFEPNHGYNYIWLLWKLYLITVNYNYWLRLPQVWFGPVVKEEMLFKRISYLVLWRPFCSAELNHLFNFGRRHHEAQSCEIILNLNRWFRKICHLKLLLIWRSVAPLQRSGSICAILVEGIMQEDHFCEIILILDQWFRRRCHLKYFLSRALAALVFIGAELFMQFW